MRGSAVTAIAIVTVTVAAACGGQGGAQASSTSGRSPSATTTATAGVRPRPAHPAAAAPIGATRRVRAGGSLLAVTVTRVFDPLAPGTAALPPGSRAVGVMVVIRNLAGVTYDSTASGDLSLQTSTGPATPLFVRSGPCRTPLVDFESLIGPGETRTGCVAFAVPGHARVVGVRFSPHSRAPGSVSWRGA